MNRSMCEPVTEACIDNIIGQMPVTKPHIYCKDCNLQFTSYAVLDAHIQGARHAKQVKSKTLLETMQQAKVNFSKDVETNYFACNVCKVNLNSIQQLHTHLNGSRHKKTLNKGKSSDVKEVDVASLKSEPVSPQPVVQPDSTKPVSTPKQAANSIVLSCTPCNKLFNSQSQLEVHLASQKHLNKIANKNKPNRFSPYQKKTTPVDSTKQLDDNFISGGYIYPEAKVDYSQFPMYAHCKHPDY
ncbi:hypothetical protein TKK_0000357 [Trichogramma kaykai]